MIRKLARPMVASVYIADGIDTLIHTGDHVPGTEAIIDRTRSALPNEYAQKVPRDPELVARALGAAKVTAGLTLALGKAQRLSAAVLAAVSVPTILARHAFWEEGSADEKQVKKNGFLTNIALLGGLIFAAVDTQGKPGLSWRAGHAAKITSKKINEALPGKSDADKFRDAAADRADSVKTALGAGGTVAAAKLTGTADKARAKAEEFWQEHGDEVQDYADTYRDRAGELFDDATDYAQDFLGDAAKKAQSFWDEATDRAHEYFDDAVAFVDDNKDDWLQKAQSHAVAAKKDVVKAAAKAQKKADAARRDASRNAAKYQKIADKKAKKAKKKLEKKFDF